MNPFDKRTARVLFTVLLFVLVLAFAWLARKTLTIFVFAMLFAYLLEPVITRVQNWTHRSRGLAIAIVYLALAGALFAVGLAAGPRIASEGRKLTQALPEVYQKITTGNIAMQLGQQRGWSYETQARVKGFLASHRDTVLQLANAIATRLAQFATEAGWFVLIPILAVFFLKDKSRFSKALQATIDGRRERTLLRGILSDMDEMLSHFVRAQLTLALISWVIYTAVLTLLRVPYSFALGAIGGMLEFIPVVGPLIAAVIILGIAFTMNYPHMLFVLLFLGSWRVVQDYVISPRILGEKAELHPLAAIFGILVGGEVGGVVGVYLAIPVMSGIRILWHRWQTYKEAEEPPTVRPELVA